jgi:hypothetical protein
MYGLDLLGLAAFPKAFPRAFPKGFALGVFANTFGNPYPHIKRILATGKCPKVRVHGIWEDNHRYQPAVHDPLIWKEFNKLKKFAAENPGTCFQFSPFCEAIGDLTEILSRLKEEAGNIGLVNSVWQGPAQKPKLAINEVHGDADRQKGVYNYSWDGDNCVDGDVAASKRRHKSVDTYYFWHPSFNGRRNVEDPTPRPERKFWPTAELIESVAYLSNQRGKTGLPPQWLWKSHADVHNVPPEPRAYKPVLLAPIKRPHLELIAANGKVVERLPYYGPFADGRHRYYASRYGYEIAEQARIEAGSAVCRLGDGKVNPAFREGGFR